MEKKFYQTKAFKKLAEAWEEKLAKEGLPDIEKTIGEVQGLKQSATHVYQQMERDRIEAKEKYFRDLSSNIHTTNFDNDIECIVMTLKADGARICEICQALEAIGQKRYRRTVRLIIRKYEHKWGIRIWRQDQLKYCWKRKPPTR